MTSGYTLGGLPPRCSNNGYSGHDFAIVMEYQMNRLRICRFCGVLELVWKDYDPPPERGPVDGVRYYQAMDTSNPEKT